MEQNYYNENNGYAENSGYNEEMQTPRQTYMPPVQQPSPQKKKKNSKFAMAAAIIAAVAIVGGGAGFGGAYVASNILTSGKNAANDGNITASYNINNNDTTPAAGKNTEGKDVSNAINALNGSDTEAAQKTSAKEVVPTGENGTYTLEELYEAVNDTVVYVKLYKNPSSSSYDYYDSYFGYGNGSRSKDTEPVLYASGSGVIFTEDGYILTNNHMVGDVDKVTVEVTDYNNPDVTHEYEAKVIGSDASTDIAVIKIDRDEPFKAAKIGNSDSLKVGQAVAAIGNPGVSNLLFKHTMTSGIVSGLGITCLADDGYSSTLIQTDAAINHGNSGGGLFDMYGNVVGIVNQKIIVNNFEGVGFAITINDVKPVIEDLLTYGYVKSRPMLGISTVALNEYRAQMYGTKLSQGLLVTGISETAPVSRSGLKIADIITKINGTNVSSLSDCQSVLSKFKVGDKITVTVARVNAAGGVDSIDIDIELTETSKN